MSGLLPYFVNLRAKVKSGLKDVVFWISAKSDARALREMENALEDADIKRSAFFKDAVITGLPVYNDLPQEGELDFTWCERYAFSDDTGTWLPIAPAQPEPAASDNASISEGDTDENATDNADSGDTTCTTSAASADTGAATAAANSDSATDTAGSANTAADTSDEVAGSEIATDIAPSCDVNVIVCGYNSKLYNDSLSRWKRVTRTTAANGRSGSVQRTECIWINPAAQNNQERAA
ncbi:hypothetical protein J3969_000612 [Salmonella enterica subsp. enterica serovar Newport]|nr:hypothetical protein [Salmonella enterica subsp. enterica serovar Newport]